MKDLISNKSIRVVMWKRGNCLKEQSKRTVDLKRGGFPKINPT
jgi:hypothetical protein